MCAILAVVMVNMLLVLWQLAADAWPSMVTISVHQVVRLLRLARGGQTVQTPVQYRFIFQFLDHCLKESVLLDIKQ